MVRTVSGAVRSNIALANKRLVKNEAVAADLIKTVVIPKDKQRELKLVQDSETAITKLEVCIESMQNYNDQWNDLIFKLTDETEIEEETSRYEKCSQSGENGGFIDNLEDAKITLRLLQKKVENIRNPPKSIEVPSISGTSADASAPTMKAIKLPAMPLPKFHGDPLQWQQFWSIFDAAVGQSNITSVQKFNFLNQQCEGIAHSAIARMQVTDTSFDDAVKILKERFERPPEQLRCSLLSELRNLPQASRPTDIRKNFDACQRILRQLETARVDVDSQLPLTLDLWSKYSYSVVEKIIQRFHVGYGATPYEIQKAIGQYLSETELLASLHSDVKPYTFNQSKSEHSKSNEDKSDYPSTTCTGGGGLRETSPTSALVATEKPSGKTFDKFPKKPRPPCHLCEGDHFNSECLKFTTVSARLERLKELGRCTKCFSPTHKAEDCRTPAKFFKCYHCNEAPAHKSALCPTKYADENSSKTAGSESKSTKVLGSCSMGANENALLLTAVTEIINPENGSKKRVRVMLDTGSHRSYVTERLVSELSCEVDRDECLQIAVFGAKKTLSIKTGRVNLNLSTRSSGQMELTFNVIPLITERYFGPGKLPDTIQRKIAAMDYAMADDFNPDIGPPDVLIGSEYFWQFIRGEPMDIGKTLFLVPTTLGLILSGSFKSDEEQQQATLVCLTERTAERCITASLEAISTESRGRQSSPDVDEFWSLERIGISDNPKNDDDERALDQFNKTVKFGKGRYQVCWPWNDQKDRLKTNYKLAVGRLQSLAKRLSSSPRSVVDEYERVIQYQAEAGIIEKVPEVEANYPKHLAHYLPHHPVVRTDHDTTKLRIVYDASAKCGKDGVSLNECMFRGPIILPDLCSILIRFRLNQVAIVSDIEKAFLQIELQETERDVTRFLWFSDAKSFDASNPIVYRFTRVPFGIISSPFILAATLRYHLKEVNTAVSNQVNDNIYVDNVITGTADLGSAISVYNESKRIFNDVSMNLREWCSNSEELMNSIDVSDHSSKRSVKVLGLNWNSETDQLRLCCDWGQRQQCRTKREVLKAIASVYDPLGLFQPSTLNAKCFLRKLWLDKLGWDDEIGDDLKREWQELHSSMSAIFEINLPRHVEYPPDSTRALVVFCDASKEAYAAAVYLRVTSPHTTTSKCNLIYAKSRLSPKSSIKSAAEISIPKLELLAIYIAAAAAQFVRDSLKSPIPVSVIIFSDSTIALGWLQSKKPLPIFIHNRVKKIRQLENAEFHHVSGPDNPADLLTRGVAGNEMEGYEFWWNGPKWLENDPNEWPTDLNTEAVTSEELRDREPVIDRPIYHTLLAGEDLRENNYPLKMDPNTFSSFRRLVRVTALCIKFVKMHLWEKLDPETCERFPTLDHLFNNATSEPVITSQELIQAKQAWIKATQIQELEDVIKAMESGKPHTLLKQLSVYKDDFGLMRCFGRFGYSHLSFESVRPLLLPKNCHLTNIVISDVHQRLFHAGISHTLSQIRREYWIPHGRNAIRKVINRCITCRKLHGAPYALPGMPPWPRERIARSAPFQFTGVDYLGPINVSVLETIQKMWVCLFTCLATRAIHLECVEDCTATSFIDCISRFISRRGAPNQLISDNAPQFRLSKTLFDRTWASILRDATVLSYVSNKGIQWKNTTALAPWQGGFYERMVGIVKTAFKSVVGRRLLKREEFITIIVEIEAIVNSRPLTYVCSDAKSGLALRPMDFITDQPNGTPDVDDDIRPEAGDAGRILLRYWKAKQRRLNSLWRQFYDDYLLSLRERYQTKHRNKRCDVHASPKLNEVVLVKNTDNTARGTWKLGKITKIIPSRDDSVRSVELQLPNRQIIQRSISLLYPLEIQTEAVANPNPAIGVDTSETEEFEGFDDADLAAIPQHLRFMDQAALDAATVCASTKGNVLASLTTTAAPLLC